MRKRNQRVPFLLTETERRVLAMLRTRKQADGSWMTPDGTKIGGDWFSDPQSTCRKHGLRSNARKLASAQIAKIPLPLSIHIARVYYPRSLAQGGRPPTAASKEKGPGYLPATEVPPSEVSLTLE